LKYEQTILEAFQAREKEIKAECDNLDREMDKKRRDHEKIQADALAKLTGAREALAAMKADYLTLESGLAAQAEGELRTTEATAEKVKAGEVSLRNFMEDGLSASAIKAKAQAQANEKLREGRRIILEKALEIFKLEAVEAEARKNIIFCATYPGQTQVKKLKAEVETLERRIGEVFSGYYLATADMDRAKLNVALSEGKSVSGTTWDALSVDELKDLRFDPRVQKYAGDLEAFIGTADPAKRFNVFLRVAAWDNTPGLAILAAL
jgi:hypothetical protein